MTTKPAWDSLQNRIAWCVANHRVKSEAAWSKAAGLSPAYVGMVRRGDRRASLEIVAKLASAANVEFQWLHRGEGHPDGIPHGSDPYLSRGPIVAMARAVGVPDGAIAAVLAEQHPQGDPGEEYWLQRIRERSHQAFDLERVIRSEMNGIAIVPTK